MNHADPSRGPMEQIRHLNWLVVPAVFLDEDKISKSIDPVWHLGELR